VIKKDHSFAPAWADLAAARAARSAEYQFDMPDEMSKMRVAAKKAMDLDPLLAETHRALGRVYARDAKWAESEKSFRKAIELDPNSAESYHDFVMFLLLPLGRIEEALKQLPLAQKADPLSPQVDYSLYYLLNAVGRDAEAAHYCKRLPDDFYAKSICLTQAQLNEGRGGEAIPRLEAEYSQDHFMGSEVRASLGCAYAQAGRREDAEKIASVSSFNPLNQAHTFACLGDKDRTFEALDRAASAGPFRMGRAINRPRFAFLLDDPRLKELRKKVGLLE
jgi:tetratricopeptide (TPR) repeat protein